MGKWCKEIGGEFITMGRSLTTKCHLSNGPVTFTTLTGVVKMIELMTSSCYSVHRKSKWRELLYQEPAAWNACWMCPGGVKGACITGISLPPVDTASHPCQ